MNSMSYHLSVFINSQISRDNKKFRNFIGISVVFCLSSRIFFFHSHKKKEFYREIFASIRVVKLPKTIANTCQFTRAFSRGKIDCFSRYTLENCFIHQATIIISALHAYPYLYPSHNMNWSLLL